MQLSAKPVIYLFIYLFCRNYEDVQYIFYFQKIHIKNKQLSAYSIVLENRAKKGERILGGGGGGEQE